MQDYPYSTMPATVERRTSKLGIASLAVAVGIFLLVLGSVILMFILSGNRSADSVILISLVGWVLAPAGHLLGLLLGVIDLFRKRSKKLVPALGVAGNAILGGIGIALLVLVGAFLLKAASAVH